MAILIISHSRKGMVRQQGKIINYIDRQMQKGRQGTDQDVKGALKDYEKVSRKGGLIDKDTKVTPD